jgi:predicted nucleic acid-binding protein
VIAIALQEKASDVITNDDGLGRIAFSMGLRVGGSPDLLLEGVKSKIINSEDYKFLLRSLVIENRITSAIAELYFMEGGKYAKD